MVRVDRTTDGSLVIESAPALWARVVIGGLFSLFALLLSIFLIAPFSGPRLVRIGCDRTSAGCSVDRAGVKRFVALADIKKAEVRRDKRGGGRGSWLVFTRDLYLAAPSKDRDVWLCTAPADTPEAQRVQTAATEIERWRSDPAIASIATDCVEDTRTLGEKIYDPLTTAPFVVALWFIARFLARRRLVASNSRIAVERRWLGLFGSKRAYPHSAIRELELLAGGILIRPREGAPLLFDLGKPNPDEARAVGEAFTELQRRIESTG